MALIKCHECGNEVSTSAKTCPKCGAPVKKQMNTAAGVGLVVVALIVVFALATGKKSSDQVAPANDTQAQTSTQPASEASAAEQRKPPPVKTLQEAIDVVLPQMTDEHNSISPGAAFLAVWANEHLTWEDLAALKQTTKARVMKDPSSERGKRMCVYGSVLEIAADNSLNKKMFVGGIQQEFGDFYRFISVGSSGDIVAGSNVRFCGVTIGRYDYDNSMNGVTHSVMLVGMFDLPENHRAKSREQEVIEAPEPASQASEPQT